jgi:hypothetical protein
MAGFQALRRGWVSALSDSKRAADQKPAESMPESSLKSPEEIQPPPKN